MLILPLGVLAQPTTALQHLDAARAILPQIPDKELKKNARTRVEELRKMFDDLSKSYPSSPEWRTKFSAVESQLTRIIGGGRGPGLEATLAGSGGSGGVNTGPTNPVQQGTATPT